MKNVFVAGIMPGFANDAIPTEVLKLKYAAIQWKYTKQNSDGSRGGVTQGAWSLTRNDKTFVA